MVHRNYQNYLSSVLVCLVLKSHNLQELTIFAIFNCTDLTMAFKSFIDNIFYHWWLTTIKGWNLIVMKEPYNSVFCSPLSISKTKYANAHNTFKKEIQIVLKRINILQYMLVSKLWHCDKKLQYVQQCASKKSWCRLILQYTLPHKLFAAPRCWNPLL